MSSRIEKVAPVSENVNVVDGNILTDSCRKIAFFNTYDICEAKKAKYIKL